MAELPIKSIERIRTPAHGHDDFLYRVTLEQGEDVEITYYALSETQWIVGDLDNPPSNQQIQDLIQCRESGRVSSHHDEDGTPIEQIRGRSCGSLEMPFVLTPDPS